MSPFAHHPALFLIQDGISCTGVGSGVGTGSGVGVGVRPSPG